LTTLNRNEMLITPPHSASKHSPNCGSHILVKPFWFWTL